MPVTEAITDESLMPSYEQAKKDPNRLEGLVIITSNLDIPDVKDGNPEDYPTTCNDNISFYNIAREGVDIELIENTDEGKNFSNSNITNILGNRFGLRR